MSTPVEIHVVPVSDGRWALRRDDGPLVSRHGTRKAAIEAGRQSGDGVIVVHDEMGRISDRPGHGPHPRPA